MTAGETCDKITRMKRSRVSTLTLGLRVTLVYMNLYSQDLHYVHGVSDRENEWFVCMWIDAHLSFFICKEIELLQQNNNKWRCPTISMKHMINEQIRDREVRVIDEQGNQLGLMSARDAQKIARERNLDLVKIAPKARPPVCKIIDYGKFRYEQAKKDKEAKKKQTIMSVKEVRLSPNIEQHDINTKQKNARKFLSKGDKLKVSVRFRGRELAHTSIGRGILLKFAEDLSDIADIEKNPKMEGRSMVMFMAPKKDNK